MLQHNSLIILLITIDTITNVRMLPVVTKLRRECNFPAENERTSPRPLYSTPPNSRIWEAVSMERSFEAKKSQLSISSDMLAVCSPCCTGDVVGRSGCSWNKLTGVVLVHEVHVAGSLFLIHLPCEKILSPSQFDWSSLSFSSGIMTNS